MSLLFNLTRAAVDYAGLFPPAGLPMADVVANYSQYLSSGESPMLGRLIAPAARLSEFEQAAEKLLPNNRSANPWRISALVPPITGSENSLDSSALDAAFDLIRLFNDKHHQPEGLGVTIDSIETKTPTPFILEATIDRTPKDICAFLEIPHDKDPSQLIGMIAETKNNKPVFAKIRTGGVTPEQIPPTVEVARFITTCARHNVGFKATAGLHHPIRGTYRLTYQDDSPTGLMHGFLNVFVASLLAFEYSLPTETVADILANELPDAFGFKNNQLTWNDYQISAERVIQLRESGIISFGSCSFAEPTQELQQIPGMSFEAIFQNNK